MKRYLVSILALLVLLSMALTLLCLLFSRSLGEFLRAAAVPMLIVLVVSYAAGSFPGGDGGRPAIP